MRRLPPISLTLPLALVTLLVGPSVLRGHIPWFMDIVAQFYPIRLTAARIIHEGQVPLWNPHYHCGVPLLANPQWATLYPINWIFFAVPTGHTFMLTYLIHHLILTVGGWWLAMTLFRSHFAAAATALALALGGWTWAHYPFGAYLAVVCWAPWILGCQERHARTPAGKWILLAGVLWGMQLLAGAPQAVFHCSQAYLALAILLAISHRNLAPLGLLFGALGLAILLGAAQLLPTLDFLGHTVRGGKLPFDQVAGGTLTLWGDQSLLGALVGGNWSLSEGGLNRMREDAESTAFVGWLGLALVALAFLPRGQREGEERSGKSDQLVGIRWGVLLLLALLWSWRGLAPLLYSVIPGHGEFHDPKRALLVAHLALGVLIGGGVAWVMSIRARLDALPRLAISAVLSLICIGSAVALLWNSPWHYPTDRGSSTPHGSVFPEWTSFIGYPITHWRWHLAATPTGSMIQFGLFIALPVSILFAVSHWRRFRTGLCAGVAIAGLIFSLTLFAAGHIDSKTISTRFLSRDSAMDALLAEFESGGLQPRMIAVDDSVMGSYWYIRPGWRWEMLPNQASVFGLLDAQGFDPTIPIRIRRYFDLMNEGYVSLYPSQFCLVRNLTSPLLDLMAVNWVLGRDLGMPPQGLAGHEPTPDASRIASRFVEIGDLGIPHQFTHLHRSTAAQSRLVHRASIVAVADIDEAIAALRILGDRVRGTAVIEAPDLRPGEHTVSEDEDYPLIIHQSVETANRLSADLESPPGWVILRDQFLPGWRATIDGEDVPIFPADVLFRAVEWPGGRHTIQLFYRPVAFRLGWFISLVSLTLLIAVLIPGTRRNARIP